MQAEHKEITMDWAPMLVQTVDLGYDQMLLLESHPRTRVRVMFGGVWLTEAGMTQDVFAASGEEVALKSRGLAVIEGLGAARVQVLRTPRFTTFGSRVGEALASMLASAKGAVRYVRTRWQLGVSARKAAA